MKTVVKFPAVLLASVVGLGALSACGTDTAAESDTASSAPAAADSESSDSSEAADAATSELLPAAEGVTQYPLTLTSPYGETVLEQRPERIVLTGTGAELDMLAALGVTPVAAADVLYETVGWAVEALPAEIETTWEYDYDVAFPLESIAAAQPDLIVDLDGTALDAETYDRLASIAPVLTVMDPASATWPDKIVQLGEALDLSSAADQVIADNDAFFENLRAEYPGLKGKTLTYFALWGGEYGAAVLNTPGSDAEAFFAELGFVANPNLEQFVDSDGSISDELVGSMDADVIIALNTLEPDNEEWLQFWNAPLFQGLPAVQNGNVLEISYTDTGMNINGTDVEFNGHEGWAMAGFTGPLGPQYAAEKLAPFLADAVG